MEQLQNTWNIVYENLMVLYDVFVTFVGFCGFRSKRTTSDLDRSRLTDTWSAENDWIEADTDPEYRINAFLLRTPCLRWGNHLCPLNQELNYFV